MSVDKQLMDWFENDKENMRYNLITKFVEQENEIYMIGSLHGMHFQLENFSFLHLKAALENIQPDLLLLESCQEEIEKGNIADGPPEMLYLHLFAKELGIPVKGIDWTDLENSKPGTTNEKRDKEIVKNIINYSKNIKKVMVVYGASHYLLNLPIFENKDFYKVELTNDEIDSIYSNLDDKFEFHKDTAKYIKIRIEEEKKLLDSDKVSSEWKERIPMLIKELEGFVQMLQGNLQ
ncbi:hypothetical protein RJG79_08030 [Mycoplasmatota bacterium WC44]